jgi:hypothetical protein
MSALQTERGLIGQWETPPLEETLRWILGEGAA